MLMTRILSEMPGIPGRRQQMPRMIRSIFTPACEARYKRAIVCGSTNEFILAMIRAGLPASACARSRSIKALKPARKVRGATISLFQSLHRRVAGQQVKERAGVFAELGAAREETQVGVIPRRGGIVIASGKVNVSANAVVVAPHDQRCLAVCFESDDPVYDVHAGFLKHAGLVDVVFLIEPGLKLHERCHLLLVFGGAAPAP